MLSGSTVTVLPRFMRPLFLSLEIKLGLGWGLIYQLQPQGNVCEWWLSVHDSLTNSGAVSPDHRIGEISWMLNTGKHNRPQSVCFIEVVVV